MNTILILGASGTGKTTALKHLNNENTDIKAFSYVKAIIGGEANYLFNSTELEGFIDFDELLSYPIDGIIIFIDNLKGIDGTDLEIMELIDKSNIPYIIFANKQDLDDSLLKIDSNVMVIPTNAITGSGIKDGFKMLLKLTENINKEEKSSERSMKDIVKDIKSLKEEKIHEKPDLKKLVAKMKPSKSKDAGKICKVKLFMHPIELDNVKEALINVGFSNLTIIEVGYVQKNANSKESYRGKDYSSNIPIRAEINLIIKYEDIKYVINALKTVKNEDIYNNVYISPIENVIRIRTEERGEDAVE